MTEVLDPEAGTAVAEVPLAPATLEPVAADSADDADSSSQGSRRVQVGTAWLMSSTALVGALNYLFTLCLVWVLPTRSYAVAASASALLLICGTIATASAPWVLAQEVARGRTDPERRRTAVSFCIAATLVQGVIGAAVMILVASRYADGAVLGAIAAAVMIIFAAATAIGYLQGFERFRLIAALRLAEVLVKIGGGLALVSLGAGAGGAIAGYALGAAVVAGVGVVVMAPDIRFRFDAVKDRELWSRARGVLFIQGGVAILASADVVTGSLLVHSSRHLATYQVSLVIARIPLILAGAISIAVFSRLAVRRHPTESATQLQATFSLFVKTVVPIVVVAATFPSGLTDRIFPSAYSGIGALLPWTAVAGGLIGAANLLTTPFQAQSLFRRPLKLLGIGLGVQITALVVGVELDAVKGLAIGSVIGAALVVVLLVRETRSVWIGSTRGVGRAFAWGLASAAPLVVLRADLVLWMAWVALVIGPSVIRAIYRKASSPPGDTAQRRRVLHLAFEDPRRPGAGGGSVRTHEIDRRLSERWEITAVCASYPGATERIEDGVRYVHIGRSWGYIPSLLTYFLCLPLALRRYPSDLVVEDFAAPFGSVGIPWMTQRPVVGVVQWLFAAEIGEKYHLPFGLVERLGLRSHRRLIAVSSDLGRELSARNPSAEVTTVRNGLDPLALADHDRPRADALYLGRLDVAQKGLDLLLDAFASVADDVDGDLLLAGDGPDEPFLRARVDALGLSARVRFLGRIPAADRFELLAGAQIVVMPSRFETFGMVAAEAMAVGTPVLSFDIPCLSELVTAETGVQITAFDVEAYGLALAALLRDPQLCTLLGDAGPRAVAGLKWDQLALLQEDVYRLALA